jgi:hypothetical protein
MAAQRLASRCAVAERGKDVGRNETAHRGSGLVSITDPGNRADEGAAPVPLDENPLLDKFIEGRADLSLVDAEQNRQITDRAQTAPGVDIADR